MSKSEPNIHAGRLVLVLGLIALGMAALQWRLLDLQVFNRDFLQHQGDARHLRVVAIPAHRGMLSDRNGEPLAISTPVESAWADPRELITVPERWAELAAVLEMDRGRLGQLVSSRRDKEFVYLRRHLSPAQAERIAELAIPGVALQREYRRYYPTGEVSAHLLGYTNIDDAGQEGLELMLDEVLRGAPGAKRVIKDRLGRVVKNVEAIRSARPGQDLRLSIDRRLQYLAYRELKAAVQRHHAEAGSAVVLDVHTGEVLAMVNQPAFNPNKRAERGSQRNRAVTDLFEPGSTIKPFTVAAALESGRYTPGSVINTSPGYLRLAGFTIRDFRDYGAIDVSTVIEKSSNVGASRIALSLESEQLWELFSRVGFGYDSASGFPGESGGLLKAYQDWGRVEQATVSYGYGMSVTALQLAQAYTTLAGDGHLRPVSFLRLEKDEVPAGTPAVSPRVGAQVRAMMERVVSDSGTAKQARIPGYRVAGKTGTVRKAVAGGYSDDAYLSLFVGMAPASRPRLVMVTIIDEPRAGEYYGGAVAAPVFNRVMEGALRLLDIPPDDLDSFTSAPSREARV